MYHKIMVILFLILSIAPQPGHTAGSDRLALIIGNSAYQTHPLANPANDADDMSAALDRLGFKTTKLKNADRRKMIEAIHSFGSRLKKEGKVGLFYYAGHAVQVAGRNFLLPVGFDVRSESDIEFEAVDMSRVLGKMVEADTDVNILILDSCRDNPFVSSFRSIRGGLARMSAPKGTFIAFATAPGMAAADGNGHNGVFTGALLKYILTPGLTIEQVMNRVRVDTASTTSEQQIPWHSSSMMGDFFFIPEAQPADTGTFSSKPTPRPINNPNVSSKITASNRHQPNRAKVLSRLGPYARYTDETIMDTDMGLMWTQKPVGIMSWLAAQKQVRRLNEKGMAGYHDWRLPNKGELLHLARFARNHRGFFSGDDIWHWSATRSDPLTSWVVNPGHAKVAWNDFDASLRKADLNAPYAIRLVRSVTADSRQR